MFERLPVEPDEPCLLDVVVACERNIQPMFPAGGSRKKIIASAAALD